MKRLILLIFTFQFLFSCNSSSQTGQIEDEVSKKDSILESSSSELEFTVFKIDSVADYTGSDERTPSYIKKRLAKLIGESVKEKCIEIGVNYPPKFVMYRFFKLEGEFEIWVANRRSDTLKMLALIPVCAADFTPGTKLREGDGKTPEGFFNSTLLYGSSYSFMWMKLNNKEIDDFGNVRKGSSFKICLDYPLAIDRARTKKILPNYSPGGQICIHGNCVSAGCISFENKDFLPVFYTAATHNQSAYGKPKIHIFPFRFTPKLKEKYSIKVHSKMSPEQLIEFWNKIEKGYNLFEKNHKAMRTSNSGSKYIFSEY